ncbi:MAG: serine/threonine protein kinase, partial [Deltaproteobacteria bacterium]|nr:serine/threonine protein kinase [Deltaproteobacteria bacterium]MBW2531351.1 serine/threonine protein kinase [Deltaproteobacteria bacterium]
MVDALALILLFGLPPLVIAYWLRLRHIRRVRELDAQQGAGHVAQLEAAKQDLEARVQNLESIVCGVDYELNAKLNRLASRQLLLEASHPTRGTSPEFAPTETLAPPSVKEGSRIADRFVVRKKLGAGGMGAVYLATDEQLGEPVALKVIAGLSLLDPSAADRFRREASAARKVSHPNVVRLHDIGESAGMLFLSMEYIAGTNLAQLIHRHGVLPLDLLRGLTVEVCQGLQAAHDAGVVHRDLKPSNILIDEHQHAKIIDFGLARLAQLEGMTATGAILGTPEYMSPEQVRGQPADARSDLYSLGAMLYHALTGQPPFTGESAIAVGFAHCSQALPPVRSRR